MSAMGLQLRAAGQSAAPSALRFPTSSCSTSAYPSAAYHLGSPYRSCVRPRLLCRAGASIPSSATPPPPPRPASNNQAREQVKTRAVDVAIGTGTAGVAEAVNAAISWAEMSYNKQYDQLFSEPLDTKKAIPKPVKDAQAAEPGSFKVLLSDVHAVGRRPLFFGRKWSATDVAYAAFLAGMHLLAACAPFTFSMPMVYLFFGMYFISGCLGITLSYHRQLSHRSFTTPKWLEYVLAYCGVLAAQGDPIEWVSGHRYHHLHTDTPLDPHSPYEGFWWSHAGWLLDNDITLERVGNRNNASDMESQWFYRWLQATWPWHVVGQFAALFVLGGFPAMVWGGALRLVWVYHVTWFVNSASHVWGNQTYNTGDLSRNNWWVGIIAFGEGWHNNHHAFEFSARHGLEWWQIDMTWMVIKALEAVGLATNLKLPSEKQKERLRFKTEPSAA